MTRTAWVILGVFLAGCVAALLLFREHSDETSLSTEEVTVPGAAAPAVPAPEAAPAVERISGRAIDEETGLAVEGAELELRDLQTKRAVERVTAEGAGRFTLAMARAGTQYELWARHAEYADSVVQVTAPQRELTVALGRWRLLRGRTADAKDGGVPAKLTFTREFSRRVVEIDTGSDGTFAVNTLSAGKYELRALGGKLYGHVEFTLPYDGQLCVAMRGTMLLSGVVVDEQGTGLPGVEVGAGPPSQSGFQRSHLEEKTVTDVRGRFELRAREPGNYFMWANAAGMHGDLLSFDVAGDVSDLRIVMKADGHVFGRVVSSRHEPIPVFTVADQLVNDADGRFSVVIKQHANFFVRAENKRVLEVRLSQRQPGLHDAGELVLEDVRTVRVKVKDAKTGAALPNAKVRQADWSTLGESGPDGVAVLTGLELTTLDVLVEHPAHRVAQLSLKRDDTEREVSLVAGPALGLTVTDARSRPVAADITLLRTGFATDNQLFIVGAGETAFYDMLAPGRWLVFAEGRDGEGEVLREVMLPETGEVQLTLSLLAKTHRVDVEVEPGPGRLEPSQVHLYPELVPLTTDNLTSTPLWMSSGAYASIEHGLVARVEHVAEGRHHAIVTLLDPETRKYSFYVVPITVTAAPEQRVHVAAPPGVTLNPF